MVLMIISDFTGGGKRLVCVFLSDGVVPRC